MLSAINSVKKKVDEIVTEAAIPKLDYEQDQGHINDKLNEMERQV